MILVAMSIVLGFVGFFLGGNLGGDYFANIFFVIGLLTPTIFAIEKIFKNSEYSREQSKKIDYAVLESLRVSGILEESIYHDACLKLNEIKENADNKIMYNAGLDILYKLSQEGIITDNEYKEKAEKLKTLYEQ
jgi:hypothetical protein